VPELTAAIEAGTREKVHQLAHRLKGSAATIGANRIADICETLCAACAGDGDVALSTELAAAGEGSRLVQLHTELVEAFAETESMLERELERIAA
jgi:chemotaxis protein histidine kinase CheA